MQDWLLLEGWWHYQIAAAASQGNLGIEARGCLAANCCWESPTNQGRGHGDDVDSTCSRGINGRELA